MPNQITSTGLETKTQAEYVAEFTAAFQAIYGADINLDSDTPDGQMMMIFIQAVLDVLDLVREVYNSFDPDNAIGVTLDQRVVLNGIQRQGGTHTVTNITLAVTQALNLYGLDQDVEPIYTVADNAGNQWKLISSQTISSAGTYVYAFQAANPGAVLTVPNTITVPVTIILGVSSINNPTTYTSLGENEESDAALKVRRQRSVSLASQGYLSALLAELENINGLTFGYVHENNTGATDSEGVPEHSIWVIVAGTASDEDIANAIYRKRNAGCGMFGSESYNIEQVDGTLFPVYWDTVDVEDLYIEFDASSLDGVNPPNTAAIIAGLVASFTPGVAEQVNINDLATLVQTFDSNTLVTNAGFSLSGGGTFTPTLMPSALNKQFAVSAPNINITVV